MMGSPRLSAMLPQTGHIYTKLGNISPSRNGWYGFTVGSIRVPHLQNNVTNVKSFTASDNMSFWSLMSFSICSSVR